MGAAIIGFVGVVIGGLLTSVLSAYQEHHRERRQLRTAARLLRERFAAACDGLQRARGLAVDPSDPSERARLFETDFQAPEWEETRWLFADHLDAKGFVLVASAIQVMNILTEYASPSHPGMAAPISLRAASTYECHIGQASALLAALAEKDLRSWPVRRCHALRRSPD